MLTDPGFPRQPTSYDQVGCTFKLNGGAYETQHSSDKRRATRSFSLRGRCWSVPVLRCDAVNTDLVFGKQHSKHRVRAPIGNSRMMDQVAQPPIPTLEQLRHVANNFPIIDSHTHNLILPTDSESIPFESITTEAQGRALRDTFKSLPHLRAARQLRQLYECGEDADWEDILGQRVEWLRSNPQLLHKRCFEGVHALLVDDGLADPRKVYPFDSHDEYLQAPSKRIVRIETVAERIMQRLLRDAKDDDLGRPKFLPNVWTDFTDDFERDLQDAVRDHDVAGFKTVVCYRTGLDVEPDYEVAARAVGHPFERYVKSAVRKRSYRIEKKPLNDYIVLRALEILSEKTPHSDSLAKPMQFHVGLGDNDIDLLEANPAYLQKLIEAYPSVPFVLLHAGYPFTKEAGYLTAVYRHVYLDVGEVFPMVSRDGQLSILREALHLAPGSKLLYSSDGHWFPESFYLAHLQFREAWLEVSWRYSFSIEWRLITMIRSSRSMCKGVILPSFKRLR